MIITRKEGDVLFNYTLFGKEVGLYFVLGLQTIAFVSIVGYNKKK